MIDTSLAIRLKRVAERSYVADAQLTSPHQDAQPATDVPVTFALNELYGATTPEAYGRLLTGMLFADQRLRSAWDQAQGIASQRGGLALQLLIAHDDPIQALRWELLRDPSGQSELARDQRVLLSRRLESDDLLPTIPPSPPNLRTLVVIAAPSGLADFTRAEIDIDGEVARAEGALGTFSITFIGDERLFEERQRRATLEAIERGLTDVQPHVLYIVCHGKLDEDGAFLCLEGADGRVSWVGSDKFIAVLRRQATRPLLVVLVACRAVNDDGQMAKAVAPAVAQAGVAAVIGFSGDMPIASARRVVPAFFEELSQHGRVDLALAVARRTLSDSPDWWRPVLWMRLADGRLWRELENSRISAPPSPRPRGAIHPLARIRTWRLVPSRDNVLLLLLLPPALVLPLTTLSVLGGGTPWILLIALAWFASTLIAQIWFARYLRLVAAKIDGLVQTIFGSDSLTRPYLRVQNLPSNLRPRFSADVEAEIDQLLQRLKTIVADHIPDSEKQLTLLVIKGDDRPDASFVPFPPARVTPTLEAEIAQLTRAGSLAGRAMRTGRCEVLTDSDLPEHQRDNDWIDTENPRGFRGHAAVLVRVGTPVPRLIGALCLDVGPPLRLSKDDQKILLTFADKIGSVYSRSN
jgi:hypothetical protein